MRTPAVLLVVMLAARPAGADCDILDCPHPLEWLPPETVKVSGSARAIAGDTVEIGGRFRVHLAWIDAPNQGEPGFDAATDALASMAKWNLTCAVLDEDRVGQLVGQCYFMESPEGDAGRMLLLLGLARSSAQGPPLGDMAIVYETAQATAQAEKRGLWSCLELAPDSWGEIKSRTACAD